MKRIALALLLGCVAFAAALMAKDKRFTGDMSNVNRIFVGWVDMSADDYYRQGYSTKKEFLDVINNANLAFQDELRSKFPGKTIVAAKDRNDLNTAGNDLYIKFSGARFTQGYSLVVSVHLIDLKTNTEVGAMPFRTYTGHRCDLVSCMHKELDQVAVQVKELLEGK